jgi:hypothetical protein
MSTLRAMKNTIPIIMNARFFIVTFTTLFASLIQVIVHCIEIELILDQSSFGFTSLRT